MVDLLFVLIVVDLFIVVDVKFVVEFVIDIFVLIIVDFAVVSAVDFVFVGIVDGSADVVGLLCSNFVAAITGAIFVVFDAVVE